MFDDARVQHNLMKNIFKTILKTTTSYYYYNSNMNTRYVNLRPASLNVRESVAHSLSLTPYLPYY